MTYHTSILANFASRLRLALAIVCLASAPVDVVDVLGDVRTFHLTPFLLFSMLYVLVLVLEQVTKTALGSSPSSLRWFDSTTAAAALFVLMIWASVLFLSSDTRNLAFNRAIYTTWLIFFARLFVAREEPHLPKIIAWALRIFLISDLVAVTVQLLFAFNGWPVPGFIYGLAMLKVADLLRPGGLVNDPNRSSIMLILFMGLAFLSKRYLPSGARVGRGFYILGVLLALLTISRTGAVALAIFAGIAFTQSQRKFKVFASSLLIVGGIGVLGLLYLTATGGLSPVVNQAQLVLVSSDTRIESTSIHFQSIANGTGEFLGNPKIFLLGAGWGTEYDFQFIKHTFPGATLGGFDCEAVSIAVQTGVIGLACILFLMLKPLLLKTEWAPLTLVILWSCIFYQYHGDPFWWIALMIMDTPRRAGRPQERISMPAVLARA